jgi:hypothetical protein
VLGIDATLATTQGRLFLTAAKVLQAVLHACHEPDLSPAGRE